MNTSITDEQLRKALIACRYELHAVLVSINGEKVHFDGDDFHEALRLADNALAQQAPAPAVPKPAALDALDADVTALQECIAYAETGSMRGKPVGWHRDMIRAATKALAALASQAAAPAEGDPK